MRSELTGTVHFLVTTTNHIVAEDTPVGSRHLMSQYDIEDNKTNNVLLTMATDFSQHQNKVSV